LLTHQFYLNADLGRVQAIRFQVGRLFVQQATTSRAGQKERYAAPAVRAHG
jgi:hypothetical protein